jgi:hypothetical protein
MRFSTVILAALILSIGSVAFAELQNVEVGGSIRIRGNYYDFDDNSESAFVEQRTRLSVKADFTQDVSAFIEFDYYNNWGEDFRSLYLTGADFRGTGGNDVDLYQGYIEARNMWGTPLSMRVGRQELALGNQWLVGVNNVSSLFTGLSFDGLRVTFANDVVTVDAIAAKLADTLGDLGEDDADLYALYGSYIGIEDVTLDAYWLFIRDDTGIVGGLIGGDDIDIHTLGLRGAGVIGAFDFELEAAYQLGDVEGVANPWFRVFNREADVSYDELGINAELGYTFDCAWQPRVFAGAAYFGGGEADDSCWDNDVDLPFNRLFSNVRYTEFLDIQQNLSNAMIFKLGVQAMPTECLELLLAATYVMSEEEGEDTGWWLWRDDAEDALGLELGLYGTYHYSEDLVMRAGYAHFFGDDGLEEGNAGLLNGLAAVNGDDDDDYDYLFIETELCF